MVVKYTGDGTNELKLKSMAHALDLEKIKVVMAEFEEQDSKINIDLYIVHSDMKGYGAAVEDGEKALIAFSIPVYFKMKKDRPIDYILLMRALKEKMRSMARKRLKKERKMN